jgi:hypothetical protein
MISYRRNFNFQPKENHMTKIIKQSDMQPDNKPDPKAKGDLARTVYNPPEPRTPTVSDGVETWDERLKRQGKE